MPKKRIGSEKREAKYDGEGGVWLLPPKPETGAQMSMGCKSVTLRRKNER